MVGAGGFIMYTITTYPSGKLYHKSQDPEILRSHKADQGKMCINGTIETFTSLKKLVERAAEVPITPSNLKNAKRAASNFIETNIIVLDIDSKYSMQDAINRLEQSQYKYGIYSSYSHAISGKDKFHVIIPIDRPITTSEEYKATYKHASLTLFDEENDEQTCSTANLFFNSNSSTKIIYVNENGRDYPKQYHAPKSYGVSAPIVVSDMESKISKLSNRTKNFLIAGAKDGTWHQEIILVIKNMKSAGFTKEEATDSLFKINNHLTKEDEYQIEHGYKDDNFVYQVDMISEEHPVRLKYTSAKGKYNNIPAKEIIETYSKERNLTIGINGQCYLNGLVTPIDIVAEYIRDFSESILKQQLSKQTIISVMGAMKYNNRLGRFEQLKNYIKYEPTNFDWDQLLFSITGINDPILVLILKHFVWQVKRKLFNMPVTYHMMPVFVGKSGSGKSMLITKMIQDLKDIAYLDGDFNKLIDTRESFALTDYYIYFIDEMSKADKADVESIKNKITSNTIQYRILGTHTLQTGTNNATFVGASNIEIEHVIKDETSARRFFQIVTSDRMKWDQINSFNYLEMWKSIDEMQDKPYIMDSLPEIEERQLQFKHKTAIEHFVREEFPTLNNREGTTQFTLNELYVKYKDYRVQSGYPSSVGKHYFFSQIKYIVGEPKRIKKDAAEVLVYFCNN